MFVSGVELGFWPGDFGSTEMSSKLSGNQMFIGQEK
jgi:hypothetical protein